MRIETPAPRPREDGEFRVEAGLGYGKPTGDIWLDEAGALRLRWLGEADCDRLIKAACAIKEEIAAQRAQMAAPHGTRYVYEGRCQLCGEPEDGTPLHGEPASASRGDSGTYDDKDDPESGEDATDSIAASHDAEAAGDSPDTGSEIPGQPGYVVGICGHRVAGSEWRAGFRVCERCVAGETEPFAPADGGEVAAPPPCQCSHPVTGHRFRDGMPPGACLRGGCGCESYRPHATAVAAVPPAVVAGEVEPEQVEPRSGCKCGHLGMVHFLDLLAGGELTHCHACDCAAYEYVPASVAS